MMHLRDDIRARRQSQGCLSTITLRTLTVSLTSVFQPLTEFFELAILCRDSHHKRTGWIRN